MNGGGLVDADHHHRGRIGYRTDCRGGHSEVVTLTFRGYHVYGATKVLHRASESGACSVPSAGFPIVVAIHDAQATWLAKTSVSTAKSGPKGRVLIALTAGSTSEAKRCMLRLASSYSMPPNEV